MSEQYKAVGLIGGKDSLATGNYHAAVRAVGATALEIETADEDFIRSLDGIVILGGVDINPSLYHEENTASVRIDDKLDQLEFEVLKVAAKYRIPVLGICRGMQMINVFFGGTLTQHVEHAERHMRDANNVDSTHLSTVTAGCFLHAIYNQLALSVNSAHHQCVHLVGEGLRVVQFSDDGFPEALYHSELPIWGVQWHPERMCLAHKRKDTVDGLKVFEWFYQQL